MSHLKLKTYIAAVCIFVSFSEVSAQMSEPNEARTTRSEFSQKGIYVGMEYLNVTDVQSKYETTYKFSGRTESGDSKGGIHLGVAGFSVGYNQTPEFGIGFLGGIRFLQSFNKSEYGDDKIQFYIPEANLSYAVNRRFLGYAGLNATVLTGNEQVRRYRTSLGAQIGLGFRFTKSIGLNAGYTMMSQTLKIDDEFVKSEVFLFLSGFNSGLTYTF